MMGDCGYPLTVPDRALSLDLPRHHPGVRAGDVLITRTRRRAYDVTAARQVRHRLPRTVQGWALRVSWRPVPTPTERVALRAAGHRIIVFRWYPRGPRQGPHPA